jgi:chemotaxis signal transduction protein
VLIFSARTPEIEGKQIFYLFSIRQAVEVLSHADVQAVPFGPSYADGVAEWRGRVLPVLSLENCLGLKKCSALMPSRSLVMRGVSEKRADGLQDLYAIITVGATVQQLELPFACEPVAVPEWVTDASCLSGVYQIDKRLFFIVNIEKMLNA